LTLLFLGADKNFHAKTAKYYHAKDYNPNSCKQAAEPIRAIQLKD